MSSWENDDLRKLEEGRENYSEGDEKRNPEATEEFQNVPEMSENYDEGSEYDEDQSTVENQNSFTLDNVCGLTQIKETLFNTFIYPAVFPQFFPGSVRWNQILLYGPPGTGKTMLAKAMANELNAVLHRITSADLLSHWQGQTEKQIRELFREFRSTSQPIILFFDEIDGLCRRRTNTEDDSSRRIKTELLTQLDDFVSGSDNHRTFIIGATNCPWEIDSGFMRRFHKKIFIPLPTKEARVDIMKKYFEDVETDLTDEEWSDVGDRTEGYSASDLINIVMTSCCERFSKMRKSKYWEAKGGFWIPSHPDLLFSTRMNFEDIYPSQAADFSFRNFQMRIQSVKFSDIKTAIDSTPKTISPEEMLKYLDFSKNQIKKINI